MKTILSTSILALLGLAIAGCSSSSQMSSSGRDDMYNSRSDRTVASDNRTASPAAYADNAAADDGEVNSPEYSSGSTGTQRNAGSSARAQSSDEYYTDNYDYYYSSRIRRFHNPAVGAGYYDPFYTDYYWYNPRAAYYGSIYSGYFYTSPWASPWGYDPFFHPRPWGWGPGVTIGIGFGWGYPYGYPMYPGFGYPYYGWGGWGGYPHGYAQGYYHGFYDGATGMGGRNTHYGRRGDRSSTAGNYGGLSGGRGNPSGGRSALTNPATTTGSPTGTTGGRDNVTPGRATTPTTPGRGTTETTLPARGRDKQEGYQPAPRTNPQAQPADGASPRSPRVEPKQPASGTGNQQVRPGGEYQPAPRPRGSNLNETRPGVTSPETAPSPMPRTPADPAVQPGIEAPRQQPGTNVAPEPRQRKGLFGGGKRNQGVESAPSMSKPSAPRSQPSHSSPSPPRGGSFGGSSGGGGGSRSGGGGRQSR